MASPGPSWEHISEHGSTDEESRANSRKRRLEERERDVGVKRIRTARKTTRTRSSRRVKRSREENAILDDDELPPTIISSDSEPEPNPDNDREWLKSFADALNTSGEANFPLPGSKAYSYSHRPNNPLVQKPPPSSRRPPSLNPLVLKPPPPLPPSSPSSSSSESNQESKEKALALLALLTPSTQVDDPTSFPPLDYVDVDHESVPDSGDESNMVDASNSPPPRRSSRPRRATQLDATDSDYQSLTIGLDPDDDDDETPEEVDPPPPILGGFPTLTWSHVRSLLRLLPPPHTYSTTPDHTMHDHINSYTPHMRTYPQMRLVYEAMIHENTVADEPHAPQIKIHSHNDDDEDPTPPWEFYYTNHMLLSPSLSPPSLLNLTSCPCPPGQCHLPKSSCPCRALQQSHTGIYDISGFMYDPSGLLKKPGLPVFECNSLCGCGEECRNRVVSKGRKCNVMLKKTDKKGWGVFACEHIPKGTFIGIYSGELLGHEESEERAIKYDQFGRTYLFDIDWWYIDAELDAKEAKEKQQKHKETLKTTEEEESALHEQIPIDVDLDSPRRGNANVKKHESSSASTSAKPYSISSDSDPDSDSSSSSDSSARPKRRPSKYTIDAYHAGNFTRFLNHSCDPNAALTPVYIDVDEIERPLLTIFSKRHIHPHEEITFSYSGDPDVDDDDDDGDLNKIHPPTPKRGKHVPKPQYNNPNHNHNHKPRSSPKTNTKTKTKTETKKKKKKKGKKGDARVHVDCECGAAKCKGTIWRQ